MPRVKKPMKHQPVEKHTFDRFTPLQFKVPLEKVKKPKLKFDDIFETSAKPTTKPKPRGRRRGR